MEPTQEPDSSAPAVDPSRTVRQTSKMLFPWLLVLLAAGSALTLPWPINGLAITLALCAGAIVSALQGTSRQ